MLVYLKVTIIIASSVTFRPEIMGTKVGHGPRYLKAVAKNIN